MRVIKAFGIITSEEILILSGEHLAPQNNFLKSTVIDPIPEEEEFVPLKVPAIIKTPSEEIVIIQTGKQSAMNPKEGIALYKEAAKEGYVKREIVLGKRKLKFINVSGVLVDKKL